jgi:DNA modification methylase
MGLWLPCVVPQNELLNFMYTITHLDGAVQGDCLELLMQLPESSIDATVTSPPHYHQRNYGG